MKKIITLFFLLILIILSNKTKDISVFKVDNNEQYQTVNLLFDNLDITSNNIQTYLEGMDIISIEIDLPSVYEDKIGPYHLLYETVSNNIGLLVNHFRQKLLTYALTDEVVKIDYLGIKIKSVKVYTTISKLNSLITRYPQIKYV